MTRTADLAARVREVLLDGQWIANTNYQAQLRAITWQQATAKTGSLNTIAALTFHINYYLEGLLRAFESGKLEISDRHSFDLPAIRSESDWQELLERFLGNSEAFVRRVQAMDDQLLDAPFVDARYGTLARNIEGVIEHGYYHLGQISLIRKLGLDSRST